MDLKAAFYKQKDELNQLKRDYARLDVSAGQKSPFRGGKKTPIQGD